MKKILKGLIAVCVAGVVSQVAPVKDTAPAKSKIVKLDKAQLDKIAAGKISLTNPGGNTVNA